MPPKPTIKIGPLKKTELEEAARIVRLAFGTFLELPDPLAFMDDRQYMAPRFHSPHVKIVAARDGGRLIGSNVATRWGSFAFFGPLTVLPEYWGRGVAQQLLTATMKIFDGWGVRHSGLFTFPHSAKHIGLYQKFGYWPRYLTAVMMREPDAAPATGPAPLSILKKAEREAAILACAKLTSKIDKGLDLTGEIRALLKQHAGDVVMTPGAFAICLNGPGSEGGRKVCYVKFAAARNGEAFDKLLDAIDAFASSRAASIEAGVNLAREDAFRRMRAHGYRTDRQGVAMQRPHAAGLNHEGFNRADAFVIDDWR
jgi:GNAT superfamily N-acetyltransferase